VNEAAIRIKRTESLLVELVSEAFGSLNDARLHELSVVAVKCSRGRSDAKIYLDPSYFNDKEKSDLLAQLKKASSHIESYCASDQGWFKAPKMTFVFDDTMQRAQDIERLFDLIAKKGE